MQLRPQQPGDGVAAFDRQDPPWFSVVWAVDLEYGNRAAPGVLLNVSAHGARLRVAPALEIGGAVRLRSLQLGNLGCRVVGRDGNLVSLRFDEHPETITRYLAAALPASVAA